jgi:hypothetical protein
MQYPHLVSTLTNLSSSALNRCRGRSRGGVRHGLEDDFSVGYGDYLLSLGDGDDVKSWSRWMVEGDVRTSECDGVVARVLSSVVMMPSCGREDRYGFGCGDGRTYFCCGGDRGRSS